MTEFIETEFIEPAWPAPARVSARCSTRRGGHSAAPYDSFNLALHVGDDPECVQRNRRALRRRLALPAEPDWIEQTHGTRAVLLEAESSREADAAVTREPGRVAVVMTADCLPILLCDREGGEVAAVHAGWRGLEAGVIPSALESMRTPRERLLAWIGPGISQAAFEVGDEVRAAFIERDRDAAAYFQSNRPRHWLCDLGGLAERVLARHGVESVYRDPHCSFRDAELFYSYRRDGATGRMAALIWIND